ncbi:MAG TPA: YkvA family protein [Burkholderiales bacterium]|jgi:uncharacterized membrane protein YkvA (DUF1232 family)|nr:YkvA family protein [Burkholderiales bacterium]
MKWPVRLPWRARLAALKARARRMKTETVALALAARHPGTPWHAKLLIAGVVVYAVTPVDLVPDFVPVLGLIDDLIFVSLAVALAARFVPRPVLDECRERAAGVTLSPRHRRLAFLVTVAVWAGALTIAGVLAYTNYAA